MDIEIKERSSFPSHPPWQENNMKHKKFEHIVLCTSYSQLTQAQSCCEILSSAAEGFGTCLLCFTGV